MARCRLVLSGDRYAITAGGEYLLTSREGCGYGTSGLGRDGGRRIHHPVLREPVRVQDPEPDEAEVAAVLWWLGEFE